MTRDEEAIYIGKLGAAMLAAADREGRRSNVVDILCYAKAAYKFMHGGMDERMKSPCAGKAPSGAPPGLEGSNPSPAAND